MNLSSPKVPGSSEHEGDTANAAGVSASPRQPFTIRDVFFDAEGLRPAWGVLLFMSVREIFVHFLYPIVYVLLAPSSAAGRQMSPRSMLLYEGTGLLCVALATWLMAGIERRPISEYGYSREHLLRNFLSGLGWGMVLLSLLIGLLRASGLLVFDVRLLSGSRIAGYGLLWLVGFLMVALVEEMLSRGYLQFTLTRVLSGMYRSLTGTAHANAFGFWSAAVILSIGFGVGHVSNSGESPLGLVSAGIAGFLFCLSLWRTGSLWWAIGFHASWDWAQSFFYGVADSGLMVKGHLYATHPVGRPILSGGLTGPEGSLFMLLVMAIGAGVILLTVPRTHFGYIPAEASRASLD